jgi:hypothetical protein
VVGDLWDFRYRSDELAEAKDRFRAGAENLDEAIQTDMVAADAGASSTIVAEAMVRMQLAAVLLSHHMDGIASKIDATKGSYDEIENTVEGAMRYDELGWEYVEGTRTPGIDLPPLASD